MLMRADWMGWKGSGGREDREMREGLDKEIARGAASLISTVSNPGDKRKIEIPRPPQLLE